MFQAEDGSFTAKVADFGYSVPFQQDDAYIVLPRSPLCYAPECDQYANFLLAQAVKTDDFSFGLLCLWFLFERHLSGVLPLPNTMQSENLSFAHKDTDKSLMLLEALKKADSLALCANQLVMAELDLDDNSK